MTMKTLTRIFPSVKITNPNPNSSSKLSFKSSKTIRSTSDSYRESTTSSNSSSRGSGWSVYLILSTNEPIKTYVGVTTDFARRLRQHNGELKGGAKAARAGRPWICACIIDGFVDRSQACEFETKWKSLSKKLPRRRRRDDNGVTETNDDSFLLLRHREAALNKVRASLDCRHLNIDWKLNP